MTVEEANVKILLEGIDCYSCPLRHTKCRCAANVGVVAPIKCETLLLKWLRGEKLNPYWEDEEFQEALKHTR